jgi:hypothetical protein
MLMKAALAALLLTIPLVTSWVLGRRTGHPGAENL